MHPLSLSLMYIDIESMKEDLQAIKGASAVMTATTTTTTFSSSSAIVTSSKHDINKHRNINNINDNENENDDIDDNHNDNQWRKDPYVHDLKSVDSVVKEIVKVLSKGSNGKQYGVDDSLHIIKLLQMVRER